MCKYLFDLHSCSLIRSLISGLRMDAVLVIVERDPVNGDKTQSESTFMGKLTKEVNEAGFQFIRIDHELPGRNNIYFLKTR